MAAAKAKKDRIIQLNKEREAKLPPSESHKDQKKKKESLVSKALEQLDEEHDDVKHMNQMMLYSKCVTIRDKQLMEKQRIEDERYEEEKRLDKMMEIERLKMLKFHEEREKKTKDDQFKGRENSLRLTDYHQPDQGERAGTSPRTGDNGEGEAADACSDRETTNGRTKGGRAETRGSQTPDEGS